MNLNKKNLNKKLKETVNALIGVRETLNYKEKIQLYHSPTICGSDLL